MPRQPKLQPRHAPEPTAQFTRNRVVVLGASVAAMVVAAVLAWLALAKIPNSMDSVSMSPIREVTFVGDLQRVDTAELNRVAGGIRGSMLQTNLNDVKAAIKQVRWVRNADVRRRFPSTLEISLEEHRPYAKWKDGDAEQALLVNTFGEVFEAELDTVLPIFSGPQGTSKDVLANYAIFKSQLAVIGLVPLSIVLSARRAWQLRLDNGALLELGRAEASERLHRYLSAYPVVSALKMPNLHIDMRYQSGMAVRISDANPTRPAAGAAPKSTKKATARL